MARLAWLLVWLSCACAQNVPVVLSSIPTADTTDFPVDGRTAFQFAFSLAMERNLTAQAFSLNPNCCSLWSYWNDDGTLLTLKITGTLKFGTDYTMQLSTRARSTQGVPIAGPYTVPFRTAFAVPYITASSPRSGEVVAPTENIQIVFSQPMDQAFTETACSLVPASSALNPSWDPSSTILTITTQPALVPGQLYTFKLNPAIARSANGVTMVLGLNTEFLAAPLPYVTSTTPINFDVDVPINSAITVNFNVDMNQPTVEAAFSSSPALQCMFTWKAARTLVCLPQLLHMGTNYNILISASARSYFELEMAHPYAFSFSTVRAPPPPPPPVPRVVVFSPLNGATNVNPSSDITVTFSEAMDAASTEAAFSLAPTSALLFSWNADGTTLTASPQEPLPLGTIINVAISTWAKSRMGAALAVPLTFQFTTAVGPLVVATVPANNATNVSRYSQFRLLFNVPMNETSTAAAVVFVPWVACDASWSSDDTMLSLSPQQALPSLTTFVLSVSASATSQSGLPLANAYNISFSTSSSF